MTETNKACLNYRLCKPSLFELYHVVTLLFEERKQFHSIPLTDDGIHLREESMPSAANSHIPTSLLKKHHLLYIEHTTLSLTTDT